MSACTHPKRERWQARQMWMCCKCCRWFWGDKRETPERDIYGRGTPSEGQASVACARLAGTPSEDRGDIE
jgi:hypothetical protein